MSDCQIHYVPYVPPVAEALDFGDAPTAAQSGFAGSYPTTLATDRARHVIVVGGPSLNLGTPDAQEMVSPPPGRTVMTIPAATMRTASACQL